MGLTRVAREFILHWGEMSSRWGLNRTVAQVHALLYLSVDPLTAEDIAEALSVARPTSALASESFSHNGATSPVRGSAGYAANR